MNHALSAPKRRPFLFLSKLLLVGNLLTFFFLLLSRSQPLQEASREALLFAASKLVPALFPFAVLSRFLLTSGLLKGGKLFSLLGKAFHLSPDAVPAVIIGLFCGFPMGAYGASALLEKGRITEEEAFRITLFANNASAPFLLFTVSTLFADPLCGRLLLLTGTISSLLMGLFLGRRAQKRGVRLTPTAKDASPKDLPLLPLFADAVTKGGAAMVTLTAFTLFFSVVAEALTLIPPLHALSPLLVIFLEPVTALTRLASLSLKPPLACALAAFASGFSGLSVLMQSQVLFGGKLPVLSWFASRLAIATVSFLLSFGISLLLL